MRAGIALGSNLGDRRALMAQALRDLQEIHEGEPTFFLASSVFETEPQDCPPGSPLFLNSVVELETSRAPLELLKLLQALEVASGRPMDHGHHSPRSLDLDLLYCDEMTLDTPSLQLPHPGIRERLFVLKPLAEIRPELQLPTWDASCSEYLRIIHNK
ncbi:MAG: 2-amino-4-hydroxy-6-hydroxymethyldihydropteridine diphosphokinase [bacterium]